MGESSACLVRSLSQPSPSSSEEKKGNPIHRALTTSISFGRFMSESLDWEKWSAFTHNRHLEEVERYSKPGSVAEKKAYFEAHFKRRRAAALLEQQNAAASDSSQTNTINNIENSNNSSSNIPPVPPVCQIASHDDASIERNLEDVEEVVENPVESRNHLEKDECFGGMVSKNKDHACNKDDSPKRNSTPSIEKKPEVISSSICVKAMTPSQFKNSDKTPESKRKDLSNKRRSYITSLHMSINLGETQKAATSSNLPKIVNSRIVRAPAKKYKNSAVPQTSTRASVNGMFKNLSAASPAENKRTITQNGDSVSGSRIGDGKLQSPSINHSKSSSIFGSKARLPTVSSSFTFKSEERAAKRKEFFQKLEQKSKSKETEKQQLHAKSQGKTRCNIMDLRNSIAFKATKSTEVPPNKEILSNLTKKIPTVRASYAKFEERAAFKVQENETRSPWRLSTKTEGSKNNNRPPITPAKCFSKKSMNENAFKVQENETRSPWRLSAKTEGSKNNNRPPITSAKCFSKKSMNENASPNIQL